MLATPFLAAAVPPGGPRVTDMLGRRVALARPPRRIVLLDARDIMAMALLHPDPASLVAGWAGVELLDSDLLRRDYDARPGGGPIPVVGGVTAESRSPEAILALAPDLVVATAQAEPDLAGGPLVRQLAAAGIPTVFSSADANRPDAPDAAGGPLDSLARLMALWGALLGREAEATAFSGFVEERLGRVTDRLAHVAPCSTYLEVQSTFEECCWAAGGRIWGALLALAGGRVPGAAGARWFAKLSPEQLIAEAPAAYIATGGAYAPGLRPAIGPGLEPEAARAALRRLAARPGLALLPAIRDGRVHGIWSGLVAIRPLNLLFVEAAARWLHPGLFRDLDPGETLGLLNSRFLARPLPGPLWVSLA
nr:ABC transporter substrate-binding protein [Roseomonas sp. GC11]